MARKYATNIDLVKNELLNAVIQVLASAPSTPKAGQVYFDSTKKQFGYYTGTTWVYATEGGAPPEATESVLGTIKLAGDIKGGTGSAPQITNLHLAADTAINHKLTAVTDPTEAQDAATKKYVDNKAAGLSWKVPVEAATIAALAANTVSGEKITSTGKEVLVIDGVTVAVGARVLVKNQAAEKDNGIYKVVKKGAAGTELWELERTTDANTTVLLEDATLFAETGSLEGREFTQTATVTTVGTTNQKWVEVQSGLAITADAVYVERNGNEIKLKPDETTPAEPGEGAVSTVSSGGARVKRAAFRGNAVLTEFTITHNLGTKLLVVQGMEAASKLPTVPIELDWEQSGVNAIKITFPAAPGATTEYFVTIIG